jgi:(2Fe-2S) ferredoxin
VESKKFAGGAARWAHVWIAAGRGARYNCAMAGFERHIFVCCNRRAPGHPRGCCAEKDSEAVRAAFKAALAEAGVKGKVRANEAGCLDQCEHGPTVVVYPEAVWYGFVTPADAAEIVREHIVGGRPVGRLRLADGCINTSTCPHRGRSGS